MTICQEYYFRKRSYNALTWVTPLGEMKNGLTTSFTQQKQIYGYFQK